MKPDVEPPWVRYPGVDPWWGGFRQGNSEAWLHYIWLPFWRSLDADARKAYLERWRPPKEEWVEYLYGFWS